MFSEKLQRMTNEVGGLHDGQASGLRHTGTPTSESDIVGHQADVSLSVKKLNRQCRQPTIADTHADTQSVTLVFIPKMKAYHNVQRWEKGNIREPTSLLFKNQKLERLLCATLYL